MAYQKGGKYQADDDTIHPIRLSTVDYAAAGTPPSGAISSSISAEVSSSRRTLGLHPRYVLLSRTRGTAPDTFSVYKRLVVLTSTAFNSTAFAKNATVTVDGVSWTVSDRTPEKQK